MSGRPPCGSPALEGAPETDGLGIGAVMVCVLRPNSSFVLPCDFRACLYVVPAMTETSMGFLNSLLRSLIRQASKSMVRSVGHKVTYRRLQKEAASRPESVRVSTEGSDIWMSPIELKLYEALRREGLSPIPQFCIQGYFVDFAFPDVRVAVEADGAQYHKGGGRQRDRKRDWVLRRHGWTVLRFRGTTIHERAANCAYVVKREIKERF